MTEERRAEVLELAKRARMNANPIVLDLAAAVIEMAAELELADEGRRVIEDSKSWIRPFNAWIEQAMRFLEATKK